MTNEKNIYGRYLHRWEAEAVARSFRRQGMSASVIECHKHLYKVRIRGAKVIR